MVLRPVIGALSFLPLRISRQFHSLAGDRGGVWCCEKVSGLAGGRGDRVPRRYVIVPAGQCMIQCPALLSVGSGAGYSPIDHDPTSGNVIRYPTFSTLGAVGCVLMIFVVRCSGKHPYFRHVPLLNYWGWWQASATSF